MRFAVSRPGGVRGVFFVASALALLALASCARAPLHERSLALLEKRDAASDPASTTFVVMGDSRDDPEAFKRVLRAARTHDPLFILHVGDVAHKGRPGEFKTFLDAVDAAAPEIPMFVTIGNHELDKNTSKANYEKFCGPLHWKIDLPRRGIRLIGLDNALYRLDDSEMAFLRESLAGERPRHVFLAMHVPPHVGRWKKRGFDQNAPEMLALAASARVDALFFGHWHHYETAVLDGVRAVVTGGAGAPLGKDPGGIPAKYHFVVVRVAGGQVSMERVDVE